MARTVRRLNHEAIHPHRSGTKIGGFYRQYDNCIRTGNGHDGYWDYREPTRKEKHHDYWAIHRDHKYHYSQSRPNRWLRNHFDGDLKTHDEGELRRYLNHPDEYEPQFWVLSSIDWRDWD